jgi:peptidoglycan/LPS O-acetylase OafA/YrhL
MLQDQHPEQSVRSQVGHLDGIEALRAIAVTWVVLFHYLVVREAHPVADPWNAWVAASTAANAIVRNGPLGVELFFLITGFLLVLPWARHASEGGARPRIRDFYVRRIRRIVPAYYVHLALLFLVFLPLLQGLHHAWANRGLVAFNAVAHSAFLHYTTPLSSASLSLNGALWSLTLEAQFYLLLPLLAPLFVRAPLACSVALFAVAGLWRRLALDDLDGLVALQMAIGSRWDVTEAAVRHLLLTQLPGYLGHFAAGMAIGWMWWRRRDRLVSRDEALAWLLALAAGLGAMYWAYALGGGAVLGRTGFWLVSIAGLSALMLASVRGGPAMALLLAHRPVLFVGRTSYSIYLYHVPILLAWNRFGILEASLWSLPLYLAAVLAAGWLSYTLVERPFLSRASSVPPL